jgi:hypothetical protein
MDRALTTDAQVKANRMLIAWRDRMHLQSSTIAVTK